MYEVGTIVYKPYRPQNMGMILAIIGTDGFGFTTYRIRWKNKITEDVIHPENDIDHLIADHQKKIATLTQKRQELLNAIETNPNVPFSEE